MNIRFVTLNTWLSKFPYAIRAFKNDLVAQGQPLVMGLQEVDRFAVRSGNRDISSHIAGTHSLYFSPSFAMDATQESPNPPPAHVEKTWQMGVALVTTMKLGTCFKVDLGPSPNVFWDSAPKDEPPSMTNMVWEKEPRSAAFAYIENEGQGFWAITTHLAHKTDRSVPSEFRASQIEVLLRTIRERIPAQAPVVLLGDMNATPENPDLDPLRAYFTLCPQQEPTFTGRNGEGLIVDHIFIRNADIVEPARTYDTPFSDHKAVGVVLRPHTFTIG